MRTQTLDYRVGDTNSTGFLAIPDRPNGAGVLVAHSAVGQSAHEHDVAKRLAALGYVALAVDVYGGARVLAGEAVAAEATPFMAEPSLLRAPMLGALEALKAQAGVDEARIAAIGYCMGGAAVFELALSGADIKAAIGFHAILPLHSPEECKAIKGAILMLQGAGDPFVSDASRAQFEKNLNEAGVDWRILVYGGAVHAFTMRDAMISLPGIAYHERTDKRSWRAMLDALEEALG